MLKKLVPVLVAGLVVIGLGSSCAKLEKCDLSKAASECNNPKNFKQGVECVWNDVTDAANPVCQDYTDNTASDVANGHCDAAKKDKATCENTDPKVRGFQNKCAYDDQNKTCTAVKVKKP